MAAQPFSKVEIQANNMERRTFLNQLSVIPLIFTPFKGSEPMVSTPARNPSAHILLYSGWNMDNIGDQGHTPGTLRFIQQHWPEAQISLWLRKTNEEVTSMLLKRFNNISSVFQGSIDEKGKSDSSELQQAFDSADLIIHNSGMHYNQFWHPSPLLEACYHTKKRLCLYGQSFDGFFQKDLEKMVKFLSHTEVIYCRDNESYYYLRSIGVQNKILEFGPDGCFGIDLANGKFIAVHK